MRQTIMSPYSKRTLKIMRQMKPPDVPTHSKRRTRKRSTKPTPPAGNLKSRNKPTKQGKMNMKKFKAILLWSVAMILTSANAVYSQTSTDSIQPTDRAKLVSLCEAAKEEVKILRPLVKQAGTALKAAETALEDERRAGS